MSAAIQPIYSPDTSAMLAHLEHLFGGYLDGCQDGLIELAWTDSSPDETNRYRLKNAAYFGTDQFEELIAEAARLNSTPMCNVYIGAALRRPDCAPFGRSKDADAYALTCLYADLDDEGSHIKAKEVYKPAGAMPTMVVMTGREPHVRAQLWWRLAEPITDLSDWSDRLRGMAKALGGDPSVCNTGRVMRLAGTVAWPVKEGRTAIELTAIVPLQEPGRPIYTSGHLASIFPPIAAIGGNGIDTGGEIVRATNSLGLQTKVDDGREKYMVATIAACLIEYLGEVGATPEPQELFDLAWPQYERGADLTRAGRGKDEFARKCSYAIKRFESGAIRGIETVDKAIEVYNRKKHARAAVPDALLAPPQTDAEGKPLPLVLTPTQFMAGFTPPEYLWDGILQRGYLYALTARTGHGKTAVGMQFGLHVAGGVAFHGSTVKQGTVLLLAGENPDDVRARFIVACHANSLDPAAVKMRFVAGVVDIAASMPVIRAAADEIADLVLVIVDTAAAYFKGDDSNSNSQQGDYARLLRQLSFLPGKPAVLVNCHPIKNAAKDNLLPMGGSAFLNEIDGNLTLWSGTEKQTTLHWQGKFRGPEFEPLTFEIVTVTCDKVKDTEGRLMPSVIARPVTSMQLEHAEGTQDRKLKETLNFIARNPKSSIAKIAKGCGFVTDAGAPQKSTMSRLCRKLADDKLIKMVLDKYEITAAGKKHIGWDD